MSLLFGPSTLTMRRYEAELAEWQATCDDMAAAEIRAAQSLQPDRCELGQYCAQQCVGLCLELPCRLGYHSACTIAGFVCCVSAPPECACDPERALWKHHAQAVQEYWWLGRLLLQNLATPCQPYYVYRAECGLTRPAKPTKPQGRCDSCCKCACGDDAKWFGACDCDCSCERVLYHVNRRLRSMMCIYAGVDSCRPSTCVGPCPCCVAPQHEGAAPLPGAAPHAPKPPRATHCASCCCCPAPCAFESAIARHFRWDGEYADARRAHTSAFVEARAAVARGEPADEAQRAYHEFVPTGEAAVGPEVPGSGSHLCERVQGRVAACVLVGCCCAASVAGLAAVCPA